MKKKKGFSLIELIVVLAIFAILTAILIPSWGYFIRRSKVRTANAKARIIFNAAQAACTEYQQAERKATTKYMDNGDFYFYWEDRNHGGKLDPADATPITSYLSGSSTASGDDVRFAQKINKLVDDQVVYKIYIKNYKVVSVTCSRFDSDRYIGAYPKSTDVAGSTPSNVLNSEMILFGV